MMKRLLIVLLVLIFILDLSIIGFALESNWRYFTKPLLVPILILLYCITSEKSNKLFVIGLVMSFFGDLILMFKGGFIAGLTSFLMAHILYIITFRAYFQKKNLYTIPLIGLFVIGLYAILYSHLGTFKIPVLAYAITIGTMLYVALGTNNKLLKLGAVLFVLSDSILAINLFYHKSTLGSLGVMFTYVIAQYFFVKGIITHKRLN